MNSATGSNETYELKSIGELLRSTRERRGITLKDIARKTKIHIGILNQLENNNVAALPCKTYVKGFIKSISQFLEINQKVALTMLEEAYDRLSFENIDLIELPPTNNKESASLKALFEIKNQKNLLDKINLHKVSAFAFFVVIILFSAINYYNATIESTTLPANLTSQIPPSQEEKIIPTTSTSEANISPEMDFDKLVWPTTANLTIPKSPESIDAQVQSVEVNRF